MDTNVHVCPQNTRKKQNASQTSAIMLKILSGHDIMEY